MQTVFFKMYEYRCELSL